MPPSRLPLARLDSSNCGNRIALAFGAVIGIVVHQEMFSPVLYMRRTILRLNSGCKRVSWGLAVCKCTHFVESSHICTALHGVLP